MKLLKVLVLAAFVGWMVIGKIPSADWKKYDEAQRKAAVTVIVKRFFEVTKCQEASLSATLDEDNLVILAECNQYKTEI